MKGDVALAGYLLTADEWEALDAPSRALLAALAGRHDDAWVVSGITASGSEPARMTASVVATIDG
jgi:hypothetical protein